MLEKMKKVQLETAAPAKQQAVVIPAIRLVTIRLTLDGVTPLVSNNFSQEMQDKMADKQRKGTQANKEVKREAKDFEKDFRGSLHVSTDGWYGFPASTFRQAMIDACRTVNYKMTHAKMGVFVNADGFDGTSGQPLVRIQGDKPEMFSTYVRLADGSPDIKSRARWKKWFIILDVEFDEDMFSSTDIVNLLTRVGRQVGIGAGRPYSKTSCGQDWGRFKVRGFEHVA